MTGLMTERAQDAGWWPPDAAPLWVVDGRPTRRERALLARAQALLRADPAVARRLSRLRLVRAELYRNVPETAPGYLYLRYGPAPGEGADGHEPLELWVYRDSKDRLEWAQGWVTVSG